MADVGKKRKGVVVIDSDSDDSSSDVAINSLTLPKKAPSTSESIRVTSKQDKKKRTSVSNNAKKSSTSSSKSSPKKKKKQKTKNDMYKSGLPLEGETFVFSGVLRHYPKREDAQSQVLELGARVTTTNSSKTTYLVLGHVLEDGRQPHEGSKYRKAKEHNTPILYEAEFEKLLEEARAKLPKQKPEAPPAPLTKSGDTQLWVDKYKPKVTSELIGNTSQTKQLRDWLKGWEKNHLNRAPGSRPRGAILHKAALLSGAPGIGKSSAASLIAKEAGYEVMELNASDTRSKKLIATVLSAAASSKSLLGGLQSTKQQKRIIIMDEVDGMSSDDRGGMQELIKYIKVTKVPIVCICNDRQKPAVRSLANYCLDLKFQRPHVAVIARRLCDIAQREGMNVELNAMTKLVDAQNRDVRQVIGALQMWSKTTSRISYQDLTSRQKSIEKDDSFRLTMFEAGKFIFNESNNPNQLSFRFKAYFIDYDLLPLVIQDNYPKALNGVPGDHSSIASLQKLADAADVCCDADLVGRSIRYEQNWGLLPVQAALNVQVASIVKGQIGFTGFPELLGRNSTRRKKSRLLSQTAMHMRLKTSVSQKTLRLDYMCTLRDHLLQHLLAGSVDRLPDTIETMDNYGIDREDLMETMSEVRIVDERIPKFKCNPFERIDSKVKASFTRLYNKQVHTSQALVRESGIVGLKKVKTKKKGKKTEDDAEDSEDNEEVEDEEEEVIKKLMELTKKAKRKTPAKRKSTSSSTASSSSKKKKASDKKKTPDKKKNSAQGNNLLSFFKKT